MLVAIGCGHSFVTSLARWPPTSTVHPRGPECSHLTSPEAERLLSESPRSHHTRTMHTMPSSIKGRLWMYSIARSVIGTIRPNVHGEGRAPLLRASLSTVGLG